MKISVIVPMYNEAESAANTVARIEDVLKGQDYEILVVNDGSSDSTLKRANDAASKNQRIMVVSHRTNLGLGSAVRTGFSNAKGDYVITIDADLSYDAKYIPILIKELEQNPDVDIVVGSPYMPSGVTSNVPFFRLLLSKMGNRMIAYAMNTKIHTVTSILRIYRRDVVDSLDLDSKGPEIEVEILAKAATLGYKIKEIPAVLKGRDRGKSKFKLTSGIKRHLMFSLYEKPIMLFGLIGIITLLLGFASGSYIFYLSLINRLDPTRPLMYVTLLLILGGILMFFFGFISTQLVTLRKEVYKVQKENKLLDRKLRKP